MLLLKCKFAHFYLMLIYFNLIFFQYIFFTKRISCHCNGRDEGEDEGEGEHVTLYVFKKSFLNLDFIKFGFYLFCFCYFRGPYSGKVVITIAVLILQIQTREIPNPFLLCILYAKCTKLEIIK